MPPRPPRRGQTQGQGQRARVRLGLGDYVPAAAANPFARVPYLRAVHRCVPDAYRELVAIGEDPEQLDAWAVRWGFTDTWARDFARLHRPFWRENPEATGLAMISTVASWEPVFPPGPSWNPIAETEDLFRARVDAYVEAMKASPGIQPAPQKDGGSEQHFEWLALHHVGRCTYRQIADRYQDEAGDPNEPAISRGITETAALVGLTLRSARGRKLSRPRRS